MQAVKQSLSPHAGTALFIVGPAAQRNGNVPSHAPLPSVSRDRCARNRSRAAACTPARFGAHRRRCAADAKRQSRHSTLHRRCRPSRDGRVCVRPSRSRGSQALRLSGSRVLGFSGSRVLGFSGSRVLGFSGSRVLGFSGSRVLGFSGSRALGSSGHQVLRRRFSGPASLRILNVPALARSIPSARRLAPLVSACPRAPRPTFAFRRPCAPAGIGAANAAAARRNGPPPHVQRAATSCLPGSREPSAASLPQPPPSARIRLTVDTACVPVNWFDCSCDSSTERSLSITSR
ncbi:Uncharacterised protein [Burkholderia pseudomallei]|nr:Uncharacterised protein [Burkholderia pseudomallei]CAJ3816586.1 Uncharacterised protein [Burkholderia pseudomallei]CAJ6106721.1 Uncharacterised protein [Burkholderia pseudomallei]CAJ6968886.1 Uncharacterised protein [Burkholderia pseudomallei]CAJ7200047.1 Uncharacterised protein [Burkholderia pseudomallei]